MAGAIPVPARLRHATAPAPLFEAEHLTELGRGRHRRPGRGPRTPGVGGGSHRTRDHLPGLAGRIRSSAERPDRGGTRLDRSRVDGHPERRFPYWRALGTDEIARILSIPSGTVRSDLSRAMVVLRMTLLPSFPERRSADGLERDSGDRRTRGRCRGRSVPADCADHLPGPAGSRNPVVGRDAADRPITANGAGHHDADAGSGGPAKAGAERGPA